MIDLLVNPMKELLVIHDDQSLDMADHAVICSLTGSLDLVFVTLGEKTVRRIGIMTRSILDRIDLSKEAHLIRMGQGPGSDGFSLANHRKIMVRKAALATS
jgi:hypothetical protein